MKTPTIVTAQTDAEIAACFEVMSQLRPHLERDSFVQTVRHLQDQAGFALSYVIDDGVQCVAGYRISEWLAGGRYLEIEDLVSAESGRSRGYGGLLFDWLIEHAKAQHCDHLRLVSRTQREDAHRFYLRKGMELQAYYFSLDLRG